jgi:hypothetical protein
LATFDRRARIAVVVALVATTAVLLLGVLKLRGGDDSAGASGHASDPGASSETAAGASDPWGGPAAARRGAAGNVLRNHKGGPPVHVTGTVRLIGTGTPVAGAEVAFMNASGEITAIADGSGRYAIDVPSGLWWKVHARSDSAVGLPEPFQASEATSRDLELKPVSTIRGRVVDARGTSVSGAVVNLEIEQGARALLEASMSLSAETERDGRFELPALPGDVTLRASRGMAQGLTQATAGDKPTDVVIRLDDPVTVRGTVVDAQGKGVQGASINALSTLAAGGINEKHRFDTNAIGEFELTMPAGHVRLVAKGGNKRTAPWVEQLTSGQRREGVTLTLVDDQIIRGKVTTPDGTPVSGAAIRVIAAQSYDAFTASDGSFEIAVPEVVSYLVKVKHAAGNIQRRVDAWNVDAGESFTLLPFGSLEIKAQNAGGDVTVAIDAFVPADGSGARAPAESSYKGPAGGVVVPMIEPGTYDFTVSSPGMKPVALRGVVVGSGPSVLPVAFEKLGAAWVTTPSPRRARPC